PHPALHSAPTRRSSDLVPAAVAQQRVQKWRAGVPFRSAPLPRRKPAVAPFLSSSNAAVYLAPWRSSPPFRAPSRCTGSSQTCFRSEEHTSELQSRENLV